MQGLNGWGSLAPPGRAQSSLSCLTSLISGSHSQTPPRPFRHLCTLTIATHTCTHTPHLATALNFTALCFLLDIGFPLNIPAPLTWQPTSWVSTPTSVLKSLEKENWNYTQTPPFLGSAGASCWPNWARAQPWPWSPAVPHVRPGPGEGAIVEKDGKDGEAWGD